MAVSDDEPLGDLAVAATLRAAAAAGRQPFSVAPEDLHTKVRLRQRSVLRLLVVDASESMQAEGMMAAAKGAVFSLLDQAYLQRERIALLAFGGDGARVVLPPTRSIALARARLAELPTGGATPLGAGLSAAWRICRAEGLKDPGTPAQLIVISDGEANVPLRDGQPIWRELWALALTLRQQAVDTVVISTKGRPGKTAHHLKRFASLAGGAYHQLEGLAAADVLAVLQTASDRALARR